MGNFFGSSNPGILVKQIINKKKTQISFFERKDGEFLYYAGFTLDDFKNDNPMKFKETLNIVWDYFMIFLKLEI